MAGWIEGKEAKEGGKSGLDYSLSHSVLTFFPEFTFCHSFYRILWFLKH